MPAESAGHVGELPAGSRLPRHFNLKKRALVRSLFSRSDADVARVRAGGFLLAVRVVDASQLPSGVRVQVGVAARRGLRGVARNRVRRVMREALRLHILPALTGSVLPLLEADQALIAIVIDRRRDVEGTLHPAEVGVPLAAAVENLRLASSPLPPPE